MGPHPLLRLHPPLQSQRRPLRPRSLRPKLHLPRHHVRRPSPLVCLSRPSNIRRKSLSQHRLDVHDQHDRRLPHELSSDIANGNVCDTDAADWKRESLY